MRIEIHRTVMALPAIPSGQRAVSYDVYVPLEDCPDPSTGYTMLCRDGEPGHHAVMDFPQATWIPDQGPGYERFRLWLDHERAAKQMMLEWVRARCPESLALTRWPTLWAYVDMSGTPPRQFTEPVTFTWERVHVPGSTTLANCNQHLDEPERARARRATCMAQERRYTVLDKHDKPLESVITHPGDRNRGRHGARTQVKAEVSSGRLPKGVRVVTAWEAWRHCPCEVLETSARAGSERA